MLNNGEPHNWCDKKHYDPFKSAVEGKENTENVGDSGKIHTSVESYIK
jgi:hypothetical protein